MSKTLIEDLNKAGVQQLDDEELEQINGGNEGWCLMDYYCLYIVHHSPEGEPEYYCLSDYSCGSTYNLCYLVWL